MRANEGGAPLTAMILEMSRHFEVKALATLVNLCDLGRSEDIVEHARMVDKVPERDHIPSKETVIHSLSRAQSGLGEWVRTHCRVEYM